MTNREQTKELRAKLLSLKLEGLSYREAAESVGVSKQRAHQLIAPPRFVREKIVEKFWGECQSCGIHVGKSGHVHHVGTEYEDYNDEKNLLLLCNSCHRQAHLTPLPLVGGTFKINLYGIVEAAKRIGISRRTMRRWVLADKVITVEFGGRTAIPLSEITRLTRKG